MKTFTVIVEFKRQILDVKANTKAEAMEKALWRLEKKTLAPSRKGWKKGLKALIDKKNSFTIKATQ